MIITLFVHRSDGQRTVRLYKLHDLSRVPCIGERIAIGFGARYQSVVAVSWELVENTAELVLDAVRLRPDESLDDALEQLEATGWKVCK